MMMIMIIDHCYSATLSTITQRRSRLQHGYCIGVSRRSAQATVSEGLAQGPCMAARAGVEPTTLQLKVIDSTKALPCLTTFSLVHDLNPECNGRRPSVQTIRLP